MKGIYMECPKCGSSNCDRVEVDIGVGIQYGPWECYECGWSQGDGIPQLFFGEEEDLFDEN